MAKDIDALNFWLKQGRILHASLQTATDPFTTSIAYVKSLICICRILEILKRIRRPQYRAMERALQEKVLDQNYWNSATFLMGAIRTFISDSPVPSVLDDMAETKAESPLWALMEVFAISKFSKDESFLIELVNIINDLKGRPLPESWYKLGLKFVEFEPLYDPGLIAKVFFEEIILQGPQEVPLVDLTSFLKPKA